MSTMESIWWLVILNCVLYTLESACFLPEVQQIGVLKLGQINLYPSWSTRWCDEVMLCGRAPLSLRIFVMESTVNRTYDVIQQQSVIDLWILTTAPGTVTKQTSVQLLADYIRQQNKTAIDFTANGTIPHEDYDWCSLVAEIVYPSDKNAGGDEEPTLVDYVLNLVNETSPATITIVYDQSTEVEVFHLSEGLYRQHVLHMLVNRATDNSTHTSHFWSQNRSLNFEEYTTILVWCSDSCMGSVFREMSNGSAPNIAVLHMLRLLVIVPDNQSAILPSRADQSDLLTDLTRNQSARFPFLLGYSTSFTDEQTPYESKYNDSTIETAVGEIAKMLQEFYHVAILWEKQECLRLQTLAVSANGGRELSYAGFGDNRGHVILRSPVFPNTQWFLNGQKLIIGTAVWDPFVAVTQDSQGKEKYTGLCIDMLNAMARSLNFTYELKQPVDGQFGALQTNGSWTGLIKMLVDKEVQMVVAPLGIDDKRVKVVDFSMPFYHDYTAVLFHQPDSSAQKLKTYLMPFSWLVFVVIGVAFVLATLFGHVVGVVSLSVVSYGSEPIGTLMDTFIYFFGSLLAQGGVWNPATGSVRMFLSAWWIFCVIVAAIYSGNLTASFAVTIVEPSFSTLQEMLAQGSFSFGAVPGTIWDNIFGYSNRSDFQRVHEEIAAFRKEHAREDIADTEWHVQRTKSDYTYAYISNVASLTLTVSDNCDLMILEEKFLPMQYAIALQKNSPLTDAVSEWVLKMNEGGLDQLWSSHWLHSQGECEINSKRTAVKTLSVIDVQSAFYLLLIGIGAALIAVAVEWAYKWRHRCKTEKTKESEEEEGRGGERSVTFSDSVQNGSAATNGTHTLPQSNGDLYYGTDVQFSLADSELRHRGDHTDEITMAEEYM